MWSYVAKAVLIAAVCFCVGVGVVAVIYSPRVFRLSRVVGAVRTQGKPGAYAVPDDHDAVAMIAATGDAGATTRARLQVRTGAEFAGEAAGMIDQMLTILYALLALAVIIAILGIVNTLTLGVIERRQEIGMLRAVGTQRRQIRTMITLESVQMTVYGAVLGVLLGLGLGWAFLTVLEAKGLTTITVPWQLILTVLVGSFLVGLLAAVWPAGRAAKTPPLDAIAE